MSKEKTKKNKKSAYVLSRDSLNLMLYLEAPKKETIDRDFVEKKVQYQQSIWPDYWVEHAPSGVFIFLMEGRNRIINDRRLSAIKERIRKIRKGER